MSVNAFIGGYTQDKFGIHRIRITDDGVIEPTGFFDGIDNPIYFAVNKAKTRLYVVQGNVVGGSRVNNGGIAVYAIDKDLNLTKLDSRSTGFSVPCYVSLDREEKAVIYAEYSFAHAGVIGLKEDGTFADEVTVHHEGHGPNEKRQESAHVHCAVTTPRNDLLVVCDLGIDKVVAYDFRNWRDGLKHMPESDIHTAPGAGPRHIVFGADGKHAYLVNELASTVQSFSFDGVSFTELQTLSMLPENCDVETKAAAIRVSPDGRWLLASNRGHDSIAAFAVNADGTLADKPVISKVNGHFPRDFAFVPGTDFVLCGHKLSDELAIYRFDAASGTMAQLPSTYRMEKPLAIAFV